ncbi:sigma-70 family RNA polymerase sigma factor [Paludibacterium paludis]|uniref:Sigma 28 (Flagella/sporulation) n=1 Tax=Paludibacterium paludis TaxID=1225769 RepID=A0A918P616_9NEIS|nr:sigma-70 family RNA polymerase sigma factor [Paludibacterium paludis]GGY28928.1 sigma 28 (flagella/sporulation) [Paludibacterium paludis]
MPVRPEECLQAEEVASTWMAFRATGKPELRASLAMHYRPLVKRLAASAFAKRFDDSIEFEDLYQFGMVGLLEALDRFDPEGGANFVSYATHRIRGEILDGWTRNSEVGTQLSARRQRLKDRAQSLDEGSGSPFEQLYSLSVNLAIGFMLDDTGMYAEAAEGASALPSAYDSFSLKQAAEHLHRRVEGLPDKQKTLLKLHYFNGMQFSEIAMLLGLSRGRVSQLHKEALQSLRTEMPSATGR